MLKTVVPCVLILLSFSQLKAQFYDELEMRDDSFPPDVKKVVVEVYRGEDSVSFGKTYYTNTYTFDKKGRRVTFYSDSHNSYYCDTIVRDDKKRITITRTWADDYLQSIITETRDREGKLLCKVEWSNDEDSSVTTYDYDAGGRLLTEEYNHWGIRSKKQFAYSSGGKLIRENEFLADPGMEYELYSQHIWTYNETDQLILYRLWTDSRGDLKLIDSTIHAYDDKGRLISSVHYDISRNYWFEDKYFLNQNDQVDSIRCTYTDKASKVQTYTLKYSYDAGGCIAKASRISGRQTETWTTSHDKKGFPIERTHEIIHPAKPDVIIVTRWHYYY